MKVNQHFSLKSLNTFGIEVFAENFVAIRSLHALREALATAPKPIHILGGGSNVLLTADLPGTVIKNEIGGIQFTELTENEVLVSVGGGVVWHNLVEHCIQNNLSGIENLSLIPGTTGAAPLQNIGAYGVELKDVFHSLEAVEIVSGKLLTFQKDDCAFGYRDSIFKHEWKGKLCITKVNLRLSNSFTPHISYGDIQKTLAEWGIVTPTLSEVSQAVVHIRRSKLPDPAELGNAGSFFKNPEIEAPHFQQLKTEFPNMPAYKLPNGKVKIPAGWLIEQAGWKGRRVGETGCHARQALVLVNYGNAMGKEIVRLAEDIGEDIFSKFGIRLHAEVNVW